MKIFVDESGSWGKKDRYFIIAMVVPFKEKRLKNIIKKYCAKKGLKEIKGSMLEFPDKTDLINKLIKINDYSISYIVLDKNNVKSPKLLEDGNLCFNYLFSFLLRKTIKNANEDIEIFVDNRTVKVSSINSLCDYMKTKAYYEWKYAHQLKITYVNSKDVKLIQMADIVANTVYAKYNRDNPHFYDQIVIAESIRFPLDKFGS